jgi:AraC-like DNA-binding protein
MMGRGPQSVVVLDPQILSSLPSYRPQETGPYFAQHLTDTKVMPVGPWRGPARLGGVCIGGFSFALIEFGTTMEVEAAVHSDHFLMMSCLRGSAHVDLDGECFSVATGRGFLARPSRHVKARFSSDCVRLAVRIDPHLLASSADSDCAAFAVDSEEMKPWFEMIRFLFSTPSFIAAGAQDPALLEDMEGILFRLLHRSPLYRAISQPRRQAASRDVRKAELFVRAHVSTTLTLADIASAAEVNVRTLQINFLRYRNMTPMEFLRNVRLDRARDLLIAGSVQVVDAASDSGFSHQGRFAARYRARFGETPSATLKRAAPSYSKLRNVDSRTTRVRRTAIREAL